MEPEILDEVVIERSGPYHRIKRWLKGTHPHLGVLTFGFTGWETVMEVDVIRPVNKFTVKAIHEAA